MEKFVTVVQSAKPYEAKVVNQSALLNLIVTQLEIPHCVNTETAKDQGMIRESTLQ